jgi:hypothetical protein
MASSSNISIPPLSLSITPKITDIKRLEPVKLPKEKF